MVSVEQTDLPAEVLAAQMDLEDQMVSAERTAAGAVLVAVSDLAAGRRGMTGRLPMAGATATSIPAAFRPITERG